MPECRPASHVHNAPNSQLLPTTCADGPAMPYAGIPHGSAHLRPFLKSVSSLHPHPPPCLQAESGFTTFVAQVEAVAALPVAKASSFPALRPQPCTHSPAPLLSSNSGLLCHVQERMKAAKSLEGMMLAAEAACTSPNHNPTELITIGSGKRNATGLIS